MHLFDVIWEGKRGGAGGKCSERGTITQPAILLPVMMSLGINNIRQGTGVCGTGDGGVWDGGMYVYCQVGQAFFFEDVCEEKIVLTFSKFQYWFCRVLEL